MSVHGCTERSRKQQSHSARGLQLCWEDTASKVQGSLHMEWWDSSPCKVMLQNAYTGTSYNSVQSLQEDDSPEVSFSLAVSTAPSSEDSFFLEEHWSGWLNVLKCWRSRWMSSVNVMSGSRSQNSWPSNTGMKMKLLAFLGPLEVHAEVIDAGQEGLQACTSAVFGDLALCDTVTSSSSSCIPSSDDDGLDVEPFPPHCMGAAGRPLLNWCLSMTRS